MSVFYFKHFHLHQENSLLKVGTDAMLLGAFVEVDAQVQNILDIGAGTGVISLMLAQKFELAQIDAIEIDESSCIDTKRNFEESSWSERLVLFQKDIKEFNFSKKYDLIVSNPPYYESAYFDETNKKHSAKHNKLNLAISELFDIVQLNLTDEGNFWVILPSENFNKWKEVAHGLGLELLKQINVYGKPNSLKRVVAKFSKNKADCESLDFIIRNTDGSYTDEYKRLTIDYHHKTL